MQRSRFQVLIDTSLKLRRFVEWIGTAAALLFIPVVVITVWDVVARKLIWIQQFMMATFGNVFSSTILQELEWHFHTALFVLVFGYGFARNSHVRVDLVRARLTSRKQAWIEFWGTTLFAIPFGIVIVYFGYRFALQSFVTNEVSVSMIGLTHRWIIKTIFGLGLVVSLIATIAVWLQTIVVLFASRDVRFELMTLEWPEELGSGVEGYQRLELGDAAPAPGEEKPGTT